MNPSPDTGSPTRLVLASQSPRRHELLALLGVEFEILPADIEEHPRRDESVTETALRLASEKAFTVQAAINSRSGTVVLAADTLVELDGLALGKPENSSHAAEMLKCLSERDHRVITGVALAMATGDVTAVSVVTTVAFRRLSESDIAWYVATGEPLDKAGAYGIQGHGGALVSRIDGSSSNVVGLPMSETAELLRSAGVEVMTPPQR